MRVQYFTQVNTIEIFLKSIILFFSQEYILFGDFETAQELADQMDCMAFCKSVVGL